MNKQIKKFVICIFALTCVLNKANSQTITFSGSTPTACYISTACAINFVISETPTYGSVKLNLKFLPDSSNSYYANKGAITYTINLNKALTTYTFSLNPSVIGRSTNAGTAIVNYATANINGVVSAYDTSQGIRTGKYEVTVSYTRTSGSTTITSASSLLWNAWFMTIPPTIQSPVNNSTVRSTFLFKDKIYDTAIKAGSKTISIYKNSDRTLLSTITLTDQLNDSFYMNALNLSESASVAAVTGLNALPDNTYKMLFSYRDAFNHAAAYDSTVFTIKSSTTPPIIITPNNTVFNAANSYGPIAYMLPDASSTAFITLNNITDNSYNVTIPVNATSQTTQYLYLTNNYPITNGKYKVTLSYADVLLNPVASASDTIIFMKSTPLPVIYYPTNGQTVSRLIIKDSLFSPVLAGSKKITIHGFSNANVEQNRTFFLNDNLTDSINYDLKTDPSKAASPTILSMTGDTVLPDGTYQITCSYQDIYGNPMVISVPVTVIVKAVKQTSISYQGSPNICIGQSITLKSSANFGNKWYQKYSSILLDTNANFTTKIPGNYYVISNFNGNTNLGYQDSSEVVTITGIPIPNTPTITKDNANNLVSSFNTNNIWFKNGIATTDTSSIYKPLAAGSYSVQTTQNGCVSALSSAYFYFVTDIINIGNGEFIQVGPNPFANEVKIDFNLKGTRTVNLDIYTLSTGNKITTKNNLNSGASLQLGQLSAGVYLFRVYSQDSKINYQFKMVKF